MVQFRGAATYALDAGPYGYYQGTSYQAYRYDAASAVLVPQGLSYPVSSVPNQLVVTDWNPVLHTLRGTFRLCVAGSASPQHYVELTEGSFDVDVD